jgi:hypothetical protein
VPPGVRAGQVIGCHPVGETRLGVAGEDALEVAPSPWRLARS